MLSSTAAIDGEPEVRTTVTGSAAAIPGPGRREDTMSGYRFGRLRPSPRMLAVDLSRPVTDGPTETRALASILASLVRVVRGGSPEGLARTPEWAGRMAHRGDGPA